MTQMEHVYLAWNLGGGVWEMAYGDDGDADGSAETVGDDLTRYLAEVERSDRAVAARPALDSPGRGYGRPLGATLVKMIDEYALRGGQAQILRFAALGEIAR